MDISNQLQLYIRIFLYIFNEQWEFLYTFIDASECVSTLYSHWTNHIAYILFNNPINGGFWCQCICNLLYMSHSPAIPLVAIPRSLYTVSIYVYEKISLLHIKGGRRERRRTRRSWKLVKKGRISKILIRYFAGQCVCWWQVCRRGIRLPVRPIASLAVHSEQTARNHLFTNLYWLIYFKLNAVCFICCVFVYTYASLKEISRTDSRRRPRTGWKIARRETVWRLQWSQLVRRQQRPAKHTFQVVAAVLHFENITRTAVAVASALLNQHLVSAK